MIESWKKAESSILGAVLAIAFVSWAAYFIIAKQPLPSTEPSKQDEIVSAQHAGATATKVHRDPDTWRGTYVRFPCRIVKVLEVDIDGKSAANAMCGAGVTAKSDSMDQVLVVLVGSKVGSLDGGQVVTITGKVLGSFENKNETGADVNYAMISLDYAE